MKIELITLLEQKIQKFFKYLYILSLTIESFFFF